MNEQGYLETKDVYLRHFKEKDLDDIFAYSSIPGVGEDAGWKHHVSKDVTKAVLYNYFLINDGCVAIVSKKNRHVIGSISMTKDSSLCQDFKGMKCFELGYVLHPRYQNKGIVSDVVKTLTEYVFSHKKADVLLISCHKDNIASRKVATKNGFVRYKILEDIYFPAIDEFRTQYCYFLENNQKR